MSAQVIRPRFPADIGRPKRAESATVIILPTVRIESYDWGGRRPPRGSRRARRREGTDGETDREG